MDRKSKNKRSAMYLTTQADEKRKRNNITTLQLRKSIKASSLIALSTQCNHEKQKKPSRPTSGTAAAATAKTPVADSVKRIIK
jgi:hypothetical protein